MKGAQTGAWICDWCSVLKKEKIEDGIEFKAAKVTNSGSGGGSWGLECLLKVALYELEHAPRLQTSTGDGSSLCSSSFESREGYESSSGIIEALSCSSEDRISQDEETMSKFVGTIPRLGKCDPKRSLKVVRCGKKSSPKRKIERTILEEQRNSVQLKRLPSRQKTGGACDTPRSSVRRYRSLSDIC
jgi:hypothetical protein